MSYNESQKNKALAEFKLARSRKDYRQLAKLAQTALTNDRNNFDAWSNLGIAYYSLRFYEKAAKAFSAASQIVSSKQQLEKLELICQSISMLSHLTKFMQDENSLSPTNKLQSHWYRNRLQDLIRNNKLESFPTVAEIEAGTAKPRASLTDCVIVIRNSRRYDEHWEETCPRDGGERSFPASTLSGFPLDQSTGGYIYLKHRIASMGCECYDDEEGPCETCREDDFPIPIYRFPKFDMTLPLEVKILGGHFLNVHVGNGLVSEQIDGLLCEQLGRLGSKRLDSPVPKYHNIIDPNLNSVNGVWVPTEFEIEEVSVTKALDPIARMASKITNGHVHLPLEVLDCIHKYSGNKRYGKCSIQSCIPDLDPHTECLLYYAIEQVFNAALPLLGNLQLPALLLPGPLQVVIKAQRIVLNCGDKYEGIWHEDGYREDVVAVVLYYYGKSEYIQGGEMEFGSKKRMRLWWGDNCGTYYWNEEGIKAAMDDLPKCATSIEQGTMIVFNNYAAVHRVLEMEATGGNGSRDFLAFFIIDQRKVLPIPKDVGSLESRMTQRFEMLQEQLQVNGHFGVNSSQVCTAGNGQVSDLAWISKQVPSCDLQSRWYTQRGDESEEDPISVIGSLLNISVRGDKNSSSRFADLPNVKFNAGSDYCLHIVKIQDGKEKVDLFIDVKKGYYKSEIPVEQGIRAVYVYEKIENWIDEGYWTDEYDLRQKMIDLEEQALQI